LNLQRDVAEAIAQQIRIELTPRQQARLSAARAVDPEAYEAYLRGRFYLTTGFTMLQPLTTAKRYFEDAIRRDPQFASAYGGLADSYSYLAFSHHLSPELAYRPAEAAVHKALELDDSLGSPHTTLAMLSWLYEWDLPAADREFQYAIALAPSDGCAHASYALYLAFAGRRAEALAEVTKSRELDPSSSFSTTETAVYYLLRDYAGLIEASRRGVASDPNEWFDHYALGLGYEGTGKPDQAIPEYQKAIAMSDNEQEPVTALAHAYAVIGKRVEAKKMLDDLERKSKHSYVSPYLIATIYAGLGDKDKAIEFLEKAYQERSMDLSWNLRTDLRIDNLRLEPRFAALARRVGFPD
jgi:Tfp pilus assembly protein PilF